MNSIDLNYIYSEVGRRIDSLDLENIFAGFRRYPFAIYTSENICLNGEIFSYESAFFGNTSIMYRGEHTAIWNYEIDPVEDMDILAANLVHEMFHCYQIECGEQRWQNDLLLMKYPDNEINFSMKRCENGLIANAALCEDRKEITEALAKLKGIRLDRQKLIGDIIRQEYLAENIEGAAEYAGCMALKALSVAKYNNRLSEYAKKLIEPSKLICDIRRVSYYVGCLYLICLKKCGVSFASMMDSDKTMYEIGVCDFTPIEVKTSIDSKTVSICSEYRKMKKERVESFMLLDTQYNDFKGNIVGYDPMNMSSSDDYVWCAHFVMLRNEAGETITLREECLLQMDPGSEKSLVGYFTKRG